MTSSPLKWMGSKKKLVPWIEEFIPKDYNTYIEPFMGSGIMFFSQEPENSICSDIQPEPIKIINSIKNNPKAFHALLVEYSDKLWTGGKEYYLELRKTYNTTKNDMYDEQQAAVFFILLRSGFNGLVRFNPKGDWNVPFGDRGWEGSKSQAVRIDNSFPLDKIEEYSNFLNTGNKIFVQQSFQDSIRGAEEGDFIYLDPPYLITTQKYNEWNIELETELANLLKDADSRGVKFILSNVYGYKGEENKELLELYKGFNHELKSHSYVVGPGKGRRPKVDEIIIFNGEV